MPYKIVKSGNENCVHKINPDGSMGQKMGCHVSEDSAKQQVSALYANEGKARFLPKEESLYREFLQVKSYIETHDITGITETPDGDVILPMKAIRFSDENDRDLHKEFFDSDTDFGHPAASEVIPVYMDHGYDKFIITDELVHMGFSESDAIAVAEEIGMGKSQAGLAIRSLTDAENIYYNVVVSRRHRYKNLIKKMAEDNLIAPSTGVKFRSEKMSNGRIAAWHPAELTLTPEGAEPKIGKVEKMADENKPIEGTPPPEDPKKETTPVETPAQEENPLMVKFNALFNAPSASGGETVLDKFVSVLTSLQEENKAIMAELQTMKAELGAQIGNVDKMVGQTHEVMPHLLEKIATQMVPTVAEAMKMSQQEIDANKARPQTPTSHRPSNPAAPGKIPTSAPGMARR